MTTLAEVFAHANAGGRAAFIPYVMAGDPDAAATRAILSALQRSGADAVELGIPYGDPLADGPTIAAAASRALANGATVDTVLEIAADSALPVILFTYYNPVLQYGLQRFAQNAKRAGVAGVIVPDLVLEEAAQLRMVLTTHAIEMPLLVAPSTPLDRAAIIAKAAGGFIYVVSRLGVTGAADAPDFAPLVAQLRSLRTVTEKPLAVGFGIHTSAHVAQIAPFADAVIVGSALVDAYSDRPPGQDAATSVEAFCRPLIAAAVRR